MLLEAARELNLALSRSVLFGDRAGDLEAARAAGVPTRILLGTNGNTEPIDDVPPGLTTARYRSLAIAVSDILKKSMQKKSGLKQSVKQSGSGSDFAKTVPDPDFQWFEEKIVAATELAARVAALPRPVVFTNGVFDLVHRGHVTYLARARALGASLVVAVNSDASVKRLGKGGDRPINAQDDRAAVLAALESVSLVTIFDEQVPLPTLDVVRPEVYVKGGDYDMTTVPEAIRARTWGARTVAIPFEHERSTTALLKRVRGA
jgi:rfaE bifunctional protein nucleotidyltransferase chain/domain